MEEKGDMLESFLGWVDEAAQALKLDEGIHKALRSPRRSLTVSFPVKMDNGSVEIFTGYRVQYNYARGPCKGGIRYHPEVTLRHTTAMAGLMALKSAVAGIPYGGAKGGVVCDPPKMSLGELERLTRRFTYMILPFIGPEKDIPAPDINTDAQTMAWIMDTFSMIQGYPISGVVTGKPVQLGGSKGRLAATGRGISFVAQEISKLLKIPLKDSTVAIQGFGNVGSYAAYFLHEAGAKIVAISDISGGLFDPKGIDIPKLTKHCREHKLISGFQGPEYLGELKEANQRLFKLNVDYLIPAATEDQITKENAPNIGAKIIIEGANGPTTSEADKILSNRDIPVVPDILANAGGAIVSYFEWVQDVQAYLWTEDQINTRLRDVIINALTDVVKTSEKYRVNMRKAAYILGVDKIAEATKLRGIWP